MPTSKHSIMPLPDDLFSKINKSLNCMEISKISDTSEPDAPRPVETVGHEEVGVVTLERPDTEAVGLRLIPVGTLGLAQVK